MDLGPVDARWMPLLPVKQRWVMLAEAEGAPSPGTPTLLAHGELGAPVLAGVEVPAAPWLGQEVEALGAGRSCRGHFTAVYEVAFVQWAAEATPWTTSCVQAEDCPGAVAAAAWKDGRHLLVARADELCPTAAWAHVVAAGPPAGLAEAADEALVDLAVAQFRRLPGWAAIEGRWVDEAQPLDSTEWDTTGGASPEVSSFRVGAERFVTVAAEAGSACAAGFAAALSTAWRVEAGQPTRFAELAPGWGPGFAPVLAALGAAGPAFLAPGRVAEAGRPALDAWPTALPACPASEAEAP